MGKVTRHEKIRGNFSSIALLFTIDIRIERMARREKDDDDDLQLRYLIDCLFFSLTNCCYFCRHYFLFLRPDRSNWQCQRERERKKKTPEIYVSCSYKHRIDPKRNKEKKTSSFLLRMISEKFNLVRWSKFGYQTKEKVD